MLAKKYLEELMRFHEEKEAREALKAKSDKAKMALEKFMIEKNKNILEEESKIEFLM
jgi:hypothetical protein